MPEEGFLMIAALGFKRGTRIYTAGAHLYGGEAKMAVLKNLYPNIVTKEDILTPEEIAPFRNHSSQVSPFSPSGHVLDVGIKFSSTNPRQSNLENLFLHLTGFMFETA